MVAGSTSETEIIESHRFSFWCMGRWLATVHDWDRAFFGNSTANLVRALCVSGRFTAVQGRVRPVGWPSLGPCGYPGAPAGF